MTEPSRSADPAPVMTRAAWRMRPAGRTGLQFHDLGHTFGSNAPLRGEPDPLGEATARHASGGEGA